MNAEIKATLVTAVRAVEPIELSTRTAFLLPDPRQNLPVLNLCVSVVVYIAIGFVELMIQDDK
jgi:hypothetical protein